MKRLLALAAAGVILTGCGAQGPQPDSEGHIDTSDQYNVDGTFQVVIVQGVKCIYFQAADGRGGGSISCDWNDN